MGPRTSGLQVHTVQAPRPQKVSQGGAKAMPAAGSATRIGAIGTKRGTGAARFAPVDRRGPPRRRRVGRQRGRRGASARIP